MTVRASTAYNVVMKYPGRSQKRTLRDGNSSLGAIIKDGPKSTCSQRPVVVISRIVRVTVAT